MFYSLPKKVEFTASQAKWQLESSQSVLVIAGLDHLKSLSGYDESDLSDHLTALLKKAKALDIPTLDLSDAQLVQAMANLGDYVAQHKQIIVTGYISPSVKAVIQHIGSISKLICIVSDATYLETRAQHIQWLNNCVDFNLHHMSSQNILRLWSLSAPRDFVLSQKGILLAVAEQLDLEPLEIELHLDLHRYGLDSVGIVSLIGLWRANGANIRYEDFDKPLSIAELFSILSLESDS